MRKMDTDQYDLAIVDPPYGLNMAKSFYQNGKNKCKNWGNYEEKKWDNETPKQEYFIELFRISKNQIIWGGNYFTNYLYPTMGWLLWDKGQRDFTLADGELAWSSFKKALRIFTFSRAHALFENKKTGGMFHPTKKPVALYKWILLNYAKEGDKILDTHLGSGSIAVACHDMGFSLDGYELDTEYYEAACKRLKEHQRQLQLPI